MSSSEEIKSQIIENQKVIDELNRKTREVKIIQEVSTEINSSLDLNHILHSILQSLDRVFHFKHSMVLLLHEEEQKLKVTASHGYQEDGIGAEVNIGQGIIGVVARRKKIMRMGNIGMQMAYSAAVKTQFEAAGQQDQMTKTIKLPGLPNLQSQVAIPLMAKERLIGVLAVESDQSNVFDEGDELIITIIANQAAGAIDNARLYEAEKTQVQELNIAHSQLKKLNDSLEEKVADRTAELQRQKEILEHANKEILDSIIYAKRIQNTILPGEKYLEEHLQDFFVLYQPKDIVSGDFYWVNKKDNTLFFSAIDCTGHGVPGALVSIVAHSNLQRAVILFGLRQPSVILDKLNESVRDGFSKNGESINDGMDIALCGLDRENLKLDFSGANSSLYIINANRKTWPQQGISLGEGLPGVEIKGDKQPIGNFENAKLFSNHNISLQKGDVLYVFTDGYADQFGGEKTKKFTRKRFKNLLCSIHHLPMQEQKVILAKTILDWKGATEQIDDITVLGVRI